MLCLTFGTGMGAGLILNGRLYEGSSGMAGEIGHIRMSEYGPVGYGKEGSFEGFCSGGGISEMARTLLLERRQKRAACGGAERKAPREGRAPGRSLCALCASKIRSDAGERIIHID